MKSFFIVLVVALTAGCADAQKVNESAVPAAVVTTLHQKFPEVKDYDWYLEDGNYEAEYDMDKMEGAVVFDAKGNLIQTEKEISVSDLPTACAAYVVKNYPSLSIREASELTDAKGVKTFEAELKGLDVIFDDKGNFLNEEK